MEVFEVLELNSVKLSRASSGSYLCMFWVLKVSCLWFGLNLYWPIGASAGSVKNNQVANFIPVRDTWLDVAREQVWLQVCLQ